MFPNLRRLSALTLTAVLLTPLVAIEQRSVHRAHGLAVPVVALWASARQLGA